MPRIAKILIALAMLTLTGWYGISLVGGEEPVVEPRATNSASIGIEGDLPDTPGEWRGRVDYRKFDEQLTALASHSEMAGLAVAVIEDGRLRFIQTYGFADRDARALVTPETVFRWASVSKTVTGTLAAELASEGAIELAQPVARWRTSLRLPGGAEQRLPFGQLLSQQTGLTKNAYDEKLEDNGNPAILRASLFGAPLQCAPGTCHTYQNVAFDAASEILTQATKRPFATAVEERFFKPLGMTSASYGIAGLTGAKSWARPHDATKVRDLREYYWRVPAAAGIESNIVDFARWMQGTMGERPDILPVAALELAQAPRVATADLYSGDLRAATADPHYGLGWRSFTYGGHRLVGHSGAVDGYRATMIFEPATRTGVVAMWNSNWGIPFRIPFAVFDSYHRREASNWLKLDDISLAGVAAGDAKFDSGSGS
ncbi:MAG: serine hydrolase domain-containing protein [Sphingorhabdus sp.]